MSKTVTIYKIPVAPEYRVSRWAVIQAFVGFLILLGVGGGIVLAFAGEVLYGSLLFVGVVALYVIVSCANGSR
jgi:hypothetical protein